MLMMMISTTTHFVKLPYFNNSNYKNTNTITSFSFSSNLLSPKMVHKNKSLAFSVRLSKTHNIGYEENDDAFSAQLDLTDVHAFTTRKVEYRPVTVFTSGFGSKHKLAIGVENQIIDFHLKLDMEYTIAHDLVAMNFNYLVSLGAQPTLLMIPRSCPEQVLRGEMKLVAGLYAAKYGYSIQFLDIETKSRQITSSIGCGSIEGPVIDGKNIQVGDVLIGLPSKGLHSHGFSLVRRVIRQSGYSLKRKLPGTYRLNSIREKLMEDTAMYVKEVLDIISFCEGGVKGIAYITNGGLPKSIPRLFQSGLGAIIFRDSWPVPPIFEWIKKTGRIKDVEMRHTFNMGIGMVLVISKVNVARVLGGYQISEENVARVLGGYQIGEVVSGDGLTYL